MQSPHKLLNELLKDYISCLPGDTGEPFTSDEDNLQIKVSTVGFDEWDRLKSGRFILQLPIPPFEICYYDYY